MKRLLLSLIALSFLGMSTQAQTLQNKKAVLMPAPPSPGVLQIEDVNSDNSTDFQTKQSQIEIGNTYFDVQSYGSTGHRIYDNNDGLRYAAWQFSAEESGWTDRGTAANFSVDGEWVGQERIEGALRGGFPSYAVNSAGDQFVSSHINEGTWELGFHVNPADDDSWATGSIPTSTPAGMVWGKIAVGGDNEDVIHAVGITLAEDFGGVVYDGLRQHPLYYRSSDKGLTWDIQDMKLPGVDSTKYLDIDAEAYTIEAKGDVVAISFAPSWGDAVLLKSTDGGDSWTNTIIMDFPLDKYDDSYAYLPEDTGMDLDDPDLPDSLAILSMDGNISMLIDDAGTVHFTAGRMFYSADGTGDRFFFPGTDGIFYWNDANPTEAPAIIAGLEDFDGDGEIGGADIAVYNRSLTSMQSIGVDADGTIYMAYSAYHELYIDIDDNQNFRQVFIIKSSDGGATWTAPYAVINAETFIEDFIPEVEGVYPQIPPYIGESIPLIYQQDFRPGLLSWGDEDPPELATVVMVDLAKDDFSAITVSSIFAPVPSLEAKVYPTVTSGEVFLEYETEEPAVTQYEITNAYGTVLQSGKIQEISTGFFRQSVNLGDYAAGIYYVRVASEGAQKTVKVVKL